MRVCPMPCVPWNPTRSYCSETTVASPRSLTSLERAAEREDLRAFHVLDVSGHVLHVAVEGDDVAHGVLGGCGASLDGDAQLGEPPIDLFEPAADLGVDVEARGHVLLLRHLEPHHVVALGRCAVDRESGRIRSSMPERLQHRGHLGADAAHADPVNDSCNSAHVASSLEGLQWGREATPPAAVRTCKRCRRQNRSSDDFSYGRQSI